jgi:2-methylisocitrate lyase-like PEP mutase family enzyme
MVRAFLPERRRFSMDVRIQAEKAELFRKLHAGPRILALPNAWDAASARVLEEAGFPAMATSSAGVAFSLGYRTASAFRGMRCWRL